MAKQLNESNICFICSQSLSLTIVSKLISTPLETNLDAVLIQCPVDRKYQLIMGHPQGISHSLNKYISLKYLMLISVLHTNKPLM